MILKQLLLAVLMVLFSQGCAHHRDVRPGVDGIHRVSVRAVEKEAAERSAISQANDYCETMKRHAFFVSENSKYTGTMDENTRDTLRKASKAATVLGT